MAGKKTVKKDSALSRVLAQRTGDWLQAHVDQYLEDKWEFRADPGWFHPSALGNPCDAALAFAFMGTKAKGTPSAAGTKRMDNGTSRHEDISRYLVESGASLFKHWGGSPEERELAWKERSFEIPSVKVRGTCDDLVVNPLTKEKYVFEFKTMNPDEWEALTAPKTDHILQLHPYMFGFGALQGQITYENKGNQKWKNYPVRFDAALWHSTEQRLLNIMEQIERRKLPWRTPQLYESQCFFFHLCGGFEFP